MSDFIAPDGTVMTAKQAKELLAQARPPVAPSSAEQAITAVPRSNAALTAAGQAGRGFIDTLISPENIGATAGEFAGRAFLPVPGGGEIGAAGGAAAGSLLRSGFRGTSPGEAVVEAGKQGAIAGASTALMRPVGALARGIKSRMLRGSGVGKDFKGGMLGETLTDDAVSAREFTKRMGADLEADAQRLRVLGQKPPLTPAELDRLKQGVFTPAELTEGGMLDELESAAEGSFMGRPLRAVRRLRKKAFESYAQSYKRSLGNFIENDDQLAAMLDGKMNKWQSEREAFGGQLYENIRAEVGDIPVDLGPRLAGLAPDMATFEKIKKYAPIADSRGVFGKLDNLLKRQRRLANPAKFPNEPPLTFDEVARMRTLWGEASTEVARKDLATQSEKEAAKVASKTFGALTDATGDALSAYDAANGTKTFRDWTRARRVWGAVSDTKARLQIGSILELAEEKGMAQKALAKILPNDIGPGQFKMLKRALGGENSREFTALRALKGRQIIDQHMKPGTDNFSGLLADIVNIRQGRSPLYMKELLGDTYLKTLEDFARAGMVSSEKNATGIRMAIRIKEGNAILQMVRGLSTAPGMAMAAGAGAAAGGVAGGLGAVGAIAVPMWMLNRWLADPQTARYVLTGMKGGVGATQAAAALVARAKAMSTLQPDAQVQELKPTATRDELRERNRAAGAR